MLQSDRGSFDKEDYSARAARESPEDAQRDSFAFEQTPRDDPELPTPKATGEASRRKSMLRHTSRSKNDGDHATGDKSAGARY